MTPATNGSSGGNGDRDATNGMISTTQEQYASIKLRARAGLRSVAVRRSAPSPPPNLCVEWTARLGNMALLSPWGRVVPSG